MNKNTTDIDYIGACRCLWYPGGASSLQASQNLKGLPRGASLDIFRGLCILGCKRRTRRLGESRVSVSVHLCRSCLFYDTRSSNLVTRIPPITHHSHSETWRLVCCIRSLNWGYIQFHILYGEFSTLSRGTVFNALRWLNRCCPPLVRC